MHDVVVKCTIWEKKDIMWSQQQVIFCCCCILCAITTTPKFWIFFLILPKIWVYRDIDRWMKNINTHLRFVWIWNQKKEQKFHCSGYIHTEKYNNANQIRASLSYDDDDHNDDDDDGQDTERINHQPSCIVSHYSQL